jgi:hypothetical protein
VGERQRPAEGGEILRENEDLPSVDQPVACDHPVTEDLLAVHAEIRTAVGLEAVDLDKRPRVQKQIDPLPGRDLAAVVLLFDPFGSSAFQGLPVFLLQNFERCFRIHLVSFGCFRQLKRWVSTAHEFGGEFSLT